MPTLDPADRLPDPQAVCDPAWKPLFGELIALKRIRSAGRQGTIAARMFRTAWSALAGGADPARVCDAVTVRALAAARLGDIDAACLTGAGIQPERALAILRDAVEAVAAPLPRDQLRRLLAALDGDALPEGGGLPAFVEALENQPRAGVTCPGRPRIILEPPESHAEHCLAVAVIGVLLAPTYGARPETVFLAALAHHFHNAGMPDSGFTGEMLLGDDLFRVMDFFAQRAVGELAPPLRARVEEARRILPDAQTPEGRAFHAADSIDRVMEIEQHLARFTLTMDRVLGEMALVHAGPVKSFQDRVLAEMGLM